MLLVLEKCGKCGKAPQTPSTGLYLKLSTLVVDVVDGVMETANRLLPWTLYTRTLTFCHTHVAETELKRCTKSEPQHDIYATQQVSDGCGRWRYVIVKMHFSPAIEAQVSDGAALNISLKATRGASHSAAPWRRCGLPSEPVRLVSHAKCDRNCSRRQ